MQINKKEKQQKCSTCGKVFGCRKCLYCHILSCPGSYKCDGCNVRFNRKDGLTCHQSGACKGVDYKKCTVCG